MYFRQHLVSDTVLIPWIDYGQVPFKKSHWEREYYLLWAFHYIRPLATEVLRILTPLTTGHVSF